MRHILLLVLLLGGLQSPAQHFQGTPQGTVAAPQHLAGSPQGFFLDAFQPKGVPLEVVLENDTAVPRPPFADVRIYPSDTLGKVSPWLFGNNANQWMGTIVDQPVLLDYIQTLAPRVIRYPGGNGSNTYFWNAEPGHLPADVPDTLLYGSGVHARRERFFTGRGARGLSVDNYYRMLHTTRSQGIICVNMGYARYGTGPDPVATAAHMAADWVRYDHGRTRFWELGNEDYGPWQAGYLIDSTRGPALISGDIYGREALVFIDSMRAAACETGADIRIGVTIIERPPGLAASPVSRNWNDGVLRQAGRACDFFIVHSYYTPYNQNTSASAILDSARPVTDHMMDYLHTLMTDYHLGNKPVALTEYNMFATGSRQQVSFIAGMHATLILGQLAARGYGLAARWDLANGYNQGNDHGLFNRGDEPGAPLWNPRPAYYYLYYFQRCFGDRLVRNVSDTGVTVFSSAFTGATHGRGATPGLGVVVVNTSTVARTVRLSGGTGHGYYYSLTGGDDNGAFSARVFVNGRGPSGPPDLAHIPAHRLKPRPDKTVTFVSPPRSVQFIVFY